MIKIINLTGHTIRTSQGGVFRASGEVARVVTKFIYFRQVNGVTLFRRVDTLTLPPKTVGVLYIVSAISLTAAKLQGRVDCIAPATFHPKVQRDLNNRVITVPGFIF